jgi:RNA polymerase sigma-70 factor (ECF subfamily)
MAGKDNPDKTDAELLRSATAGDEASFVVLYERLKTGIFRYAYYMTNSKSAAEEVTQEVFMALLNQGGNYEPSRGDVAAFAFGIARNQIRRVDRRERPYQPLPETDSLESSESGAQSLSACVIRNQVVERVQAAIASLPDHYRQVIVLCDLCEHSYAEAASRLQCAVGTVRSRLNRGHALLAQKLEPLRDNQRDIEPAGTEGCLV